MNLVVYCLRDKLRSISSVYRLPRISSTVNSVRYYSKQTEDYYQVLGVGRRATTTEIRDAFIEKSKKLHPDRNVNDPKGHEKFVKLNQAYTILSDSKTRDEYDAQDFEGKNYNYEDEYESANTRARRMKNQYHQYRNPEWLRYEEYIQRTGRVDGDTLRRIAVPTTLFIFIIAVVPFLIIGRRIKQDSRNRWEDKTRGLSCLTDERKLLRKYFLSLSGTEQRILCDLPDEEFFPELGRRYLLSQGKVPERREPSKYLSRHDEIRENQTYSSHTMKMGSMIFDNKAKGMDINLAEKKILRQYFQKLSGGQQRYLDNLSKEDFFTEIGKRYVKHKGLKIDQALSDQIQGKSEPEMVDELTAKG